MRALAAALGLALITLVTLSPSLGAAQPTEQPAPSLGDDALVAPPPSGSALASSDRGRGPSQFMAGDVALLLVLPESNGAVDRSTEDWSAAQIEAVRARVQEGLDWWQRQLPLARLRFHVRLAVVPTDYEPTSRGLAQEGLWIGDTLARLGYSGETYFDQAYAAAYGVRDELGADWGTVLFVPNSETGTGYLADGRFAYAYIGGPHLVITSDAGGYGQRHMAAVVAHELGHTFGALDQYAAARIGCDRSSGYLNTPTTNSQFEGCGTRLTSIMADAVGAFAAGQADPSTLHQVGYRDSDGDGLIDPLDTSPAVELHQNGLASTTGRPLIRGATRDIAFPSSFQPDVTIHTIEAVEYRVDGGPWIPAAPADGAFDSAEEEFSAELPLYNGSYSVELRAMNSAGLASPAIRRSIEITSVGPAPRYAVSGPPATADPEVTLQLEAPPTTEAIQISASTSFSGATWQPYAPTATHTLSAGDGPRPLYVRFRDQFGLESLPFQASLFLDTAPPQGSAIRSLAEPALLMLSAVDAGTAVVDVEVRVAGDEPLWQPYATRMPIPRAAPEQTVQVRFRDAVGNVSAPVAASVGYKVMLPLIVR